MALSRSVATAHPENAFRARAIADIAVFALLIGVIVAKALLVADVNWDTFAYHLPFTARRVGLISAEAYRFTDWLEACYRGFPPLPYYVYGFLWRLTGSINAPNIVSGLGFALYCVIIARTFRLPLTLLALALAAIPTIQVNLASIYVDLVANLGFSAALVFAAWIVIEPDRPLVPRVAAALGGIAVAANWKIPFIMLGGAAVAGMVALLWLVRRGPRRLFEELRDELRGRPLVATALSALTVLCAASALRDLALFRNPIYPMGLKVAGIALLPGVDAAGQYSDPVYLRAAPQFVRWTLSALDYLSIGPRPLPYTLGQGNVPPYAESLRMGGYLGLFVVYNLIIFGAFSLTHGPRFRAVFFGFIAMTLLVSGLPGSHELRYYGFWMMTLVTLNIVYLWRFGESAAERLHFGAVVVAAFIFLGAITGFTYFGGLSRDRVTIPQLFAGLGLPTNYVPKLHENGKYCLANWGPYPMLGSPILIKTPHFSVQELDRPCPPDAEIMDFTKLSAGATP